MGKILEFCVNLFFFTKHVELCRILALTYGKKSLSFFENPEKKPALKSQLEFFGF